ncbi:MAG TPA: DUF1772 domain-containing protein, partial [Chthoniobacterales bacterium]|nr:DUF1772 domain-containing protein [Chthoniobacterales bacterium]
FGANNGADSNVIPSFCRRRATPMKKLVLCFSIICASGLTLLSIYNTVIDAQSWASDIPASIQTARDYFQHVDPRRFYAVAGPINVILILLTIVLFWKDGVSLRVYFAISLLMYVAIVAVTLAYFIPRDLILFTWSIPDHLDQIRTAAAEWSHMNWLRTVLGLIGVLFSFKGLDAYYDCATEST